MTIFQVRCNSFFLRVYSLDIAILKAKDDWLKEENIASKDELKVREYWSDTFELRRKFLQDANTTSNVYLKTYRALSLAIGIQLVNIHQNISTAVQFI